MQIIVASDTHGRNERLLELEKLYPEAALFLHAGDWGTDPKKYDHWVTVMGNNDIRYERDMEKNRIILADGHKIFMLHGQQLPYGNREKRLADMANQNGCDIAIYGHSHKAFIEEINGVLVINPGYLLRSRDGRGISYIVLTLDKNQVDAKLVFWMNRPDQP